MRLAANERRDGDLQVLTIEVTVEIEEKCFEEPRCLLAVKRRPMPYRDSSGIDRVVSTLGGPRVDAILWEFDIGSDIHVRGRITELSAAMVSLYDDALCHNKHPETLPSFQCLSERPAREAHSGAFATALAARPGNDFQANSAVAAQINMTPDITKKGNPRVTPNSAPVPAAAIAVHAVRIVPSAP